MNGMQEQPQPRSHPEEPRRGRGTSDRLWDLFIIYAGEDRTTAEELYDALANRIRVFLDVRCLPPDADFDRAIPRALAQSANAAVLISRATADARFARSEIVRALSLEDESKRRHRVIPIYLSGTRAAPESIPYGLETKTGLWLAEFPSISELADNLVNGIGGLGDTHGGAAHAERGEVPIATSVAIVGLIVLTITLGMIDAVHEWWLSVAISWIGLGMIVWLLLYASPEHRHRVGV